MKHIVYCEYSFFEGFLKLLYGRDFLEYINTNNDISISLIRLLLSFSIIRLDKSPEDIVELSKVNPYIKSLLKSGSLESEITDYENFEPQLEQQNSLFLLDREIFVVEKLREKFGLWFIALKNFTDERVLFTLDHHFFVRNNSDLLFKNYGFFKKYQHPCNSLILSDSYLFTYDTNRNDNTISLNISPILRKLLPKKLTCDFHLTIVSSISTALKYEDVIEEIRTELSYLPYQLKINFIKTNFHQRFILSNYFKILSDKGFKNLTFEREREIIKHERNSFDFVSTFSGLKVDKEYVSLNKQLKLLNESKGRCGDDFTNRLL
jgi:hypothetical protein